MRHLLCLAALFALPPVAFADPYTDLRSRDHETRTKAAATIMASRPAGAAGPLCRAIAVETDAAARAAMLDALEKVDPAVHPFVATLAAEKYKPRADLAAAVRRLKKNKPAARFLVPYGKSIVPTADGPDAWRSIHVVSVIADVVREADPTVEGFADMLLVASKARRLEISNVRDNFQAVTACLADAALNSPNDLPAVVNHLGALLGANDEEWVTHAAQALGRIGPPARGALPQLRKLKLSESGGVRAAATAAVKAIGQ